MSELTTMSGTELSEVSRSGSGSGSSSEDDAAARAKRSSEKGDRLGDKEVVRLDMPPSDEDKFSSGEDAKLFAPVKEGMDKMREDTAAFRELDLNSEDEKDNEVLCEKLITIMTSTTRGCVLVRDALRQVRRLVRGDNKKRNVPARNNLYNHAVKQVLNLLSEWDNQYRVVRSRDTENKKRHLRAIEWERTFTERELNEIISKGKQGVVARRIMMKEDITPRLPDIVYGNEERHGVLLQFERQLMKLISLLKELSALIDREGGGGLSPIDAKLRVRVERDIFQLPLGEEELEQAFTRKCRIMFGSLFVTLCILFVIIYFAGK